MRLAFPDIAFAWYLQGLELYEVEAMMAKLGRVLEVLLYRDLTTRELQRELGVDVESLIADLTLLEVLGYVATDSRGIWKLNTPVFTREDYESLRSFARLVLKEVADCFKSRMGYIRELYGKTAPARNGIPLEEAFNALHHLVFAETSDKLVKNGRS